MRAYEFPVKVTPEGRIDLPATFAELLPRGQTIRVIVLVNEPADVYEPTEWARLTADQFLAGYSDADAIYDKVR